MKKALLAAITVLLALGVSAEEVSSDVAEDAARGWINLREALGEEITAEVFEAHAAEIFEEAENRLHAQKAVLVECMLDRETEE